MKNDPISKKKVLFVTLGSLGDLHPVMGVAHELIQQGHEAGIATSPFYKDYVESTGLRFHPIHPDLNPFDKKIIETVLDPYRGPERLHRDYIMPNLEQGLLDCLEAAKSYDVLVAGVLCYFVPIASKVLGIPWISQLLSPMCMWSAYDPPVLAPLPWLGRARSLGPTFHRFALKFLLKISEPWAKPVYALRKKYGLDKGPMPLSEGIFSEHLSLCLWHDFFGPPQPDWAAKTKTTGFVFYDPQQHVSLPTPTLEFLQAGDAPVLFTLGSTAVEATKSYLDVFLKAAQQLNKRAILTVGKKQLASLRHLQNKNLHLVDYAPYSLLFPKVSAVVHQGGVGTTAQAFAAGIPMLILAKSMDQFDNGDRAKRLGTGEILSLRSITPQRIFDTLEKLTSDPTVRARCNTLAQICAQTNGANATSAEILKFLDLDRWV